MPKFILQNACGHVQQHRHGLLENPKSSAIWAKSPLAALQYHDKFNDHTYSTDMCRFSSLPDGQRHRKETKLKSSFKLRLRTQQKANSSSRSICTEIVFLRLSGHHGSAQEHREDRASELPIGGTTTIT
eukprot:53882-Pyramimonas_sp.AAC.1